MNRQDILSQLQSGSREFDLVVIGGGITGAGIAREAAGSGLRTLLVEQKDFAWGTSSRSSKMVHGGLRYLGSGQYRLTRDAVTERQRLMAEAPGLIEPLRFIMPHYRRQFPAPFLFQALLAIYDRLARFRSRQRLAPTEASAWVPGLDVRRLSAASGFVDAVTDDARLVQRVLQEARRDGALCLNYVRALEVEHQQGQVSGVRLQAEDSDEAFSVTCPRVINATGAWASVLQSTAAAEDRMTIRPLRGSHLVVPWSRLPVSCSVSLLHPEDRRPVFAFPWLGTTVLGTTDLDHDADRDSEPCISEPEVNYLLQVASQLFPGSRISRSDIISSWAGVRPVITDGTGKAPSRENREHALHSAKGLVTVAGGKLTTFRQIAREALALALGPDSSIPLRDSNNPVFQPAPALPRPPELNHDTWRRLQGYYGTELPELLASGPLQPVLPADSGHDLIWAEVCWACTREDVRHLDDLLLRRTRLGLVVPEGARELLPELKRICQPLLNWSDARWNQEQARYLKIRDRAYALPEGEQTHAS